MARVVPLSLSLEVGGHQYVTQVWALQTGEVADGTERWLLDSTAVRWLLDRVADGDISAERAAELVREVSRWNSDCCYWCDLATPAYPEVLRRHRDAYERWQRQQRSMTPETHPYLLDNGTVHRWDCAVAPPVRGPGHPGTDVHTYAAWHGPLNGDVDRIMAVLWEETRVSRRITEGELEQWLLQRNHHAGSPWCRRCSPEPPGAPEPG
ncbi:hypothetical protein [Lentzea nigeriaca]|uniref:hypothetical protein n=1 Tax=Lentzea nigeriaca TaxID=1128665 RepID=UPI00195DB70A|nr:hypothetical protein [Lentzea nigeriaca]MBM7859168.1 hypothetical protein [Lentzea nigeriaca]